MPDVHVDFWLRLAGVGVDQLEVQVEGNAVLSLSDILANKFARDI